MKKLLSVLLLIGVCVEWTFATEFQAVYKDGKGTVKIKFLVAKVNGVNAWTNAEKNNLIADFTQFSATSPVDVQLITPTQFELNLSTCALSFDSGQDYLEAQTQKGIIPVLEALIVRLQAYQASGMNAKAANIQQRLDYLASEAKNLP